jgi:hypothetical protein
LEVNHRFFGVGLFAMAHGGKSTVDEPILE